ncbi:uncharacterized protein fs(1)Ya isoform X2 [Euwallacea similis]|uniref:uncharacterized protein fs(1)Ya isoform X2 n=1 Tax=Euwallacea similis TaxID=1736056 RepID=UPI00344E0498
MQGFEENNCRVCIKSFCCGKCRQKHESKVHNVIYSGCDICVYGRTFHHNRDKVLLQHIKEFHLPLHCVYCYQFFYNVEEIPQGRCSVAHFLIHKEDSPKTPLFRPPPPVLVATSDQNSPILQNLLLKEGFNHLSLATSTPMQKAEENVIMFEKCNEEPLTPVDNNCAKSQIRCKSIIKNANSIMKQDSSSKRRVTFGEPSESNTNKSIINPENKKNSPNKDTQVTNVDRANCKSPFTPVVGANRSSICSNQFYSAKSEITQFNSESRLSNKNREKENEQQENSTPVCGLNTPKTSNNGSLHKLPNQNSVAAEETTSEKYDTTVELLEGESPIEINPPPSLDEASKKLELNKEKSEEKLEVSTSLVMLLDTPANPAGKCPLEEPSPLLETEIAKSESSSSPATSDATECKTVWLSAANPENLELSERKLNTPMKNELSENRRASVVVMPTPILKKTDIKMKFHVPAHFSSTPIMSMGSVKLRQTKIVEEVTTRIINQQTPYKTPQGKMFSLTEACTSLNNEAVRSCHRGLLPLSENNEDDNISPSTEIGLLEFKGRNDDFSDSSIKCSSFLKQK